MKNPVGSKLPTFDIYRKVKNAIEQFKEDQDFTVRLIKQWKDIGLEQDDILLLVMYETYEINAKVIIVLENIIKESTS